MLVEGDGGKAVLDEEIDFRPCCTGQFRWEQVGDGALPQEFVEAVGEEIEASGIV